MIKGLDITFRALYFLCRKYNLPKVWIYACLLSSSAYCDSVSSVNCVLARLRGRLEDVNPISLPWSTE